MNSNSPSKAGLTIAVTANDDRARYLFDALAQQVSVAAEVEFDRIDPATRYTAAALRASTVIERR